MSFNSGRVQKEFSLKYILRKQKYKKLENIHGVAATNLQKMSKQKQNTVKIYGNFTILSQVYFDVIILHKLVTKL